MVAFFFDHDVVVMIAFEAHADRTFSHIGSIDIYFGFTGLRGYTDGFRAARENGGAARKDRAQEGGVEKEASEMFFVFAENRLHTFFAALAVFEVRVSSADKLQGARVSFL